MIRLAILFFTFSSVICEEKWFTQRLDHFDYENREVWRQRYFANSDFYKTGGPAFLQIGGEGPANPAWMVKGHWIDIARDVGAMAFIVEHRFYGESHPTNDTAVENLRYLTSEQALADLARFIQNMTIETGISEWITFGGSYPGSLSLWMRLKYPILVQGAMSASAPLLAKLDFFEYNEVVNRSLTNYGGAECVESISVATTKVQKMLKSTEGRKQLKDTFNLCSALESGDDEYFQSTIYDPVAETVQYNRDNRISLFIDEAAGGVTIETLCNHMTDKSIGDEVERYATLPNLFGIHYDRKRIFSRRYKSINNGADKCVDASYANYINSMKKPRFSADRTWVFQTCTEFGWYQTTDSPHQPFKGFSLDLFTDMCYKIYGHEFVPESITEGIMETNANYGAKKISEAITNACLFNGGVDPWHAMSYVPEIHKESLVSAVDVNPSFHTLFVPSSAHCAVMYPDHPDDPQALREARALSAKYVKSWLK